MEEHIRIARLIGEHMIGKPCSPKLQAWIDESEMHRELFHRLSDNNELVKEILKYDLIDTENEWILMQNRLDRLKSRKPHLWLRWPLRIAALLIPVVLVIYFMSDSTSPDNNISEKIYNGEQIQPGQISATLIANGGIYNLNSRTHLSPGPDGMMVTDISSGRKLLTSVDAGGLNHLSVPRGGEFYLELEDGTTIWLNAETELYFPTHFGTNERRIRVNGEAYIEVADNNRQPFYIEAGNSVIHVTGTALNLRNYADESITVVTLAHGSIQMETLDGTLLATLAPSDQFVMRKDGSYYTGNGNLDEVLAWHNGLFIFHDRPLKAIAGELERWYNVTIEVESTIADKCYSGDLIRSHSIEPWLNIMESTGELEIVRSADGVLHIMPAS